MFKGKYKEKNSDGTSVGYIGGDTIVYEGVIYKALFSTSVSPFQNAKDWQYIGVSSIFSSSFAPINPQIGQQWENGGKLYTYYYDGNSYAWIEL
jgi:hypothetical protein